MVLAELNVRHTRRHMPTRRVALDGSYLPTGGPAYGAALLQAVVAEHVGLLDEEQQELLPRLVHDARRGLSVPRIAMRYRLQTDTHGLDRSRHRIVADPTAGGAPGGPVLELDRHGSPDPQVVGAVLAAAGLPPGAARVAFAAVERGIARPGVLPEGLRVRRLLHGVPGLRPRPGPPSAPGAADITDATHGAGASGEETWRGVPTERRWAMEVLGLRPGMPAGRVEVQRRFRRLVRLAHPDHGAEDIGAAERLAELAEAREVLLASIASAGRGATG